MHACACRARLGARGRSIHKQLAGSSIRPADTPKIEHHSDSLGAGRVLITGRLAEGRHRTGQRNACLPLVPGPRAPVRRKKGRSIETDTCARALHLVRFSRSGRAACRPRNDAFNYRRVLNGTLRARV
jgi:hypothetical protein